MISFKQYLREAEEAAGNYPTDTNPLVDATKPYGLNNPKIIFIGDDPNTGEYKPVGKNPVAPNRFGQWDNEQMHARNKGYMLKYVGHDEELAKRAEWEGDAPTTGKNMAGEPLPAAAPAAAPAPAPAAPAANPPPPLAEKMLEMLKLAGVKETEIMDKITKIFDKGAEDEQEEKSKIDLPKKKIGKI
jgi:hypothetical protein